MKYDLVVIQEDAAPLASGIQSNFPSLYVIVLAVLVCCMVLTLIGSYIWKCHSYHIRLQSLFDESGMDGYHGWNLTKLKEEQNTVANQVVSHKMD